MFDIFFEHHYLLNYILLNYGRSNHNAPSLRYNDGG